MTFLKIPFDLIKHLPDKSFYNHNYFQADQYVILENCSEDENFSVISLGSFGEDGKFKPFLEFETEYGKILDDYLEIKPTNQFADPRDGNIYQTVEINGQTWLAENLRYEGVAHSVPNGYESNVKHGCLYTWDNALKACPEGWHLPSEDEFIELLIASGLGYNVPPGDYINIYNYFRRGTCLWSATEYYYDQQLAYYLRLDVDNEDVKLTNKKLSEFMVRCIKG